MVTPQSVVMVSKTALYEDGDQTVVRDLCTCKQARVLSVTCAFLISTGDHMICNTVVVFSVYISTIVLLHVSSSKWYTVLYNAAQNHSLYIYAVSAL